ncbi:MAG: hypothetical protein LBH46_04585 [Rickettsiales bacterium]|jgi:hypothetical protein|nr:hypothetical protein [Rickettsiales bacterium]
MGEAITKGINAFAENEGIFKQNVADAQVFKNDAIANTDKLLGGAGALDNIAGTLGDAFKTHIAPGDLPEGLKSLAAIGDSKNGILATNVVPNPIMMQQTLTAGFGIKLN